MKKIFTTVIAMLVCVFAQAQWNENGNLLMPEHTKEYGASTTMDKNGNLWMWNYIPSSGELYDQRIQCISSTGELLFGENGISLANTKNMSWTMCNQELLPCSDGTMIAVICDSRDQQGDALVRCYYAYRMDTNGNQLWGENGIRINEPVEGVSPSHISMLELPNGNVVFVFEEYDTPYTGMTHVGKQCLDKDGNKLYSGDNTVYSESKLLVWPTVVSDEAGGYYVLFGRTENWYLYVMHFDGEGNPTWDSSFGITRKSTWSGKPMWYLANAIPNGEGDILVYWQDVRDYGPFFPYLACIDKDKNSKFINAAGTADSRVSYSGISCQSTQAIVAPDGQSYFVAFLEESATYNNRVVLQKVALDSELLFGDEGKVIEETDMHINGNLHLTYGPDNTIAIIWIENNIYNIDLKELKIQLVDPETGEFITPDPLVQIIPGGEIGALEVSTNKEQNCWMLYWQDAGVTGDKHYDGYQNQYALRINFDGTIGNPASGISMNQMNDNDNQAMYNLAGQRIKTPKGVYIMNGKKYVKY